MLITDGKNVLKSEYRHPDTPRINAPLNVRSCGHYVTYQGWHEPPKSTKFFELFWGISGKGEFIFQGKKFILDAGDVFCYRAGDLHNFTAFSERWEFCWFTVDGEASMKTVESFDLTPEIRHSGPCPADIFMQMQKNLITPAVSSAYRAGGNAYEIMSLAAAGNYSSSGLLSDFHHLAEELSSTGEISVDNIARALNVHRSTLSRKLQKEFNLSPREYLLYLRLRKALGLITYSRKSFKSIAFECGFSSQHYFSRFIRSQTGLSPTAIREQAENGGVDLRKLMKQ